MRRRREKVTIKSVLRLVGFLVISGVGLVVALLNMDKVQEWWAGAEGVEANILIDWGVVVEAEFKPVINLTQGGEARDYSFRSSMEKLRMLGPEYIRVDHIYDFYNIVDRVDGRLVYDWSGLDRILGEIRQAGAKPLISLSYMPGTLSGGDVTGVPQNWWEWAMVVEETVKHVSGKPGLNLDGVYYEVWNEPDLFGGWKMYGEKNYLLMYKFASTGAGRVTGVNEFSLGGPATTSLYENWVAEFLGFVEKEGLRLDFYSWHHYGSEIDGLGKDRLNWEEWSQDYGIAADLELLVTEWGHDSEVDEGYDGAVGAAHTLAGLMGLPGELGKVFVFEWQDGLDADGKKYWGRWGLLTHESFGGEVKPRYRALEWWKMMVGDKVRVEGEGTFVRALGVREGGRLKLMLVNCDPRGKNAEQVPIRMTGLEPGMYKVRIQRLGRGVKEHRVMIGTENHLMLEVLQANEAVRVEMEQE